MLLRDKYNDSLGFPTIGVGHLIKPGEQFPDKITIEAAKNLFDKDFKKHLDEASGRIPVWKKIDDVRRGALLDMTFNMGVGGVLGFKNTLTALEKGEYDNSAKGVMNSLYARQVGKRALVNANLLKSGDPQHIVQHEPSVYAEKGAYFAGDVNNISKQFFKSDSIPAEIHPNEAIIPLQDEKFRNELTKSLSAAMGSSVGFGRVTEALMAIVGKMNKLIKGDVKSGKITNESLQNNKQVIKPRKVEDTDTGKELLRQQSQIRVPEYIPAPPIINSGSQQASNRIEQLRPVNAVGKLMIEQIFSNTITNLESSAKQFALGQNPFRILR